MNRTVTSIFIFSMVAGITGCATSGISEDAATSSGDEATLEAQHRIATLEADLRRKEQELAQARTGESQALGDLFPPNPKPGECYARVLIPERYRTVDERVLVREESERVEVIPAKYETASEQVVIREASTRIEVIPAEYETVTERVMVRPASTKLVEVPAIYQTVTEQVLDKPAHTVWKKGPASAFGNNVLSQRVSGTGEVMCLVEVPATYKTVTRKVIDKPAQTQKVEIPAEYKVVQKRVLKTSPQTREVQIPAEYGRVEVTRMVQPAKERRFKIPAEYAMVSRTEKVSDAKLEWQPVLCEVNATRSTIGQLQAALQKAGYYAGPIDGVIGPKTISGVNSYAEARNIPTGDNYIPMAVVKDLDINPLN